MKQAQDALAAAASLLLASYYAAKDARGGSLYKMSLEGRDPLGDPGGLRTPRARP